MSPAKPTKVKAIKYSMKAWVGVNIQASPKTICKIPQRKPEIMPALTPQRSAIIKIGTMANEIEIDGCGLIDGKRSSSMAIAANIAISSKV